MKSKLMKVDVPYIVIKKGKDGSFQKGDHVKLLDDGSILNHEAQGWMEPEDVKEGIAGMEVDIDKVWIDKKISDLQKEIEKLECWRNCE